MDANPGLRVLSNHMTASPRPEAICLSGLPDLGVVADDRRRAAVYEVLDCGDPVVVPSADDDLVSILEQRLRSQPSKTVCGAGDEDTCHRSAAVLRSAPSRAQSRRRVGSRL